MAKMLMASFTSPEAADHALYDLERAGYTASEISIISKDNHYQSTRAEGSNVPASAATGATTGGVIGGLAGLLAGVGILPAVAGLFIGGPITAMLGLAGAAATTVSGAVTGAAAGGLLGALMGIGVPRDTASAYDEVVAGGGVVIGLAGHPDQLAETRAILERRHAENISEIDAREDTAHTATTETTRETATPAATATTTRDEDAAPDTTRRDYIPQHPESAFGERIAPNTTHDSRDIEDA
jgi:hypothetical protein